MSPGSTDDALALVWDRTGMVLVHKRLEGAKFVWPQVRDGVKGQHTVVVAAIRQAFTQPDSDSAGQTWLHVADQIRARWPKLAALMDESEADVLAYMNFPSQHRTKLHSTNPLERLNKEVKRRADVVGLFPNEEAIIRLIGAVFFEQNDDWLGQHRYMQTKASRR